MFGQDDHNERPDVLGVSPGQVVLDRYELFEPCGFGGTASVWRAWVKGTEDEVAVKIQTIGPRTGAHRPERLEREYQILQQLNSPNTVKVSDFGYLPDGRAVLVFEFLKGQTLGDVLEDRPVLELREALDIVAQMLRALVEAHSIGVVHRDIKPENVMLLDNPLGEERHLKLFDFGISKVLERDSDLARAYEGDELASLFRSLTSAEMTVGTPEYMAPEQISATALGPFTDVYAIGVVFHELLFGEVPYSGDSFFEIAHRHLAGILPPLPAHLPEVIHTLLWTSLAKRFEDRYQDASQMLEAVEAAIQNPEVILFREGASLDIHHMDELSIASLGPNSHETPPELRAVADASRDDVTPWGVALEKLPSPPPAPVHVEKYPLQSLPSIEIPQAVLEDSAPPWNREGGVLHMMSRPLARSATPLSAALADASKSQENRVELKGTIEAAIEYHSLGETPAHVLGEDEPETEEGKEGDWERRGTLRWGRNFMDNG